MKRDNDAALLRELADSNIIGPGSMMRTRLLEIADRLERLSPDDELEAELEARLERHLRDPDIGCTHEGADLICRYLGLRESRRARQLQHLSAVVPAIAPMLASVIGNAMAPLGPSSREGQTPPEEPEPVKELWLARSANAEGHDLFAGRPEGPNEYGDYTGRVLVRDVAVGGFGPGDLGAGPVRVTLYPFEIGR